MYEKDFETLAVGYLTTRTVELVKYIKLHRYELEKRAERFDDTVMDDVLKEINRAKSSERNTVCMDL
ncbi:MAG: hypothetical protein II653_07275 [Lachnospiraceae bacterium]|nr:hypothetical protein [Lachnospiraceae bacterium]